jgi:DNA-binding response OmpR family regulator
MSISRHILLVEDDINLAFVVRDNLEQAGYQVSHAKDGEQALALWQADHIDLCIFDVMLPKKDGFTLAQEIRQLDGVVPILFVTARGQKEDRLHGFRIGGDDYLTKPFSIEELLLRIDVFLRRSSSTAVSADISDKQHELGKYIFAPADLSLTQGSNSRKLTQREAEVLLYLANHLNQICAREAILLAIWGDDDYFLGRSLDVFISRLRKFLQDDPTVVLENVHGVGFRLKCASTHSSYHR